MTQRNRNHVVLLAVDLAHLPALEPGHPPKVRRESVCLDAVTYRRYRCPHCRKRMAFSPWQDPATGAYRGMMTCAFCAFEEEV